MPLLPAGYITLPVGAVYLVASLVHDAHAPEARITAPFDRCHLNLYRHAPRRPDAPGEPTPRLMQFDLVSTGLRIDTAFPPNENDPTVFEAAVSFRDRQGRRLYVAEDGRDIETLVVSLKPPVLGCLSSSRLHEGANSRDFMMIGAPFPEELRFNSPMFETRLVTRYRQVLGEGLLAASLVDGEGVRRLVPADYWRSDRAIDAIVEVGPVTIALDGQERRGHLCVDFVELRDEWRRAFGLLPVDARMSEAIIPAWSYERGSAPLLEFIQFFTVRHNIINGRGPDGLPIMYERLKHLIENEWPNFRKFRKEDLTQNRIDTIARIIRHPDDQGGGPKMEGGWSVLGA